MNSPVLDLSPGSRCLHQILGQVLKRVARPEGGETDALFCQTETFCFSPVTFLIRTPGRHVQNEPMETEKAWHPQEDTNRYEPSAEWWDCSCCTVWLFHWQHWNPSCTGDAMLLQRQILSRAQSSSGRIWTCWGGGKRPDLSAFPSGIEMVVCCIIHYFYSYGDLWVPVCKYSNINTSIFLGKQSAIDLNVQYFNMAFKWQIFHVWSLGKCVNAQQEVI